jgi:hypothetical protein
MAYFYAIKSQRKSKQYGNLTYKLRAVLPVRIVFLFAMNSLNLRNRLARVFHWLENRELRVRNSRGPQEEERQGGFGKNRGPREKNNAWTSLFFLSLICRNMVGPV